MTRILDFWIEGCFFYHDGTKEHEGKGGEESGRQNLQF